VGRQLCEAGWTAEMIARHDPDSGRVTLSLEVELKTTRNPRGRDGRMSETRGCAWTDDGVRAQVVGLREAVTEHLCLIADDGRCECGARWVRFAVVPANYTDTVVSRATPTPEEGEAP
jgi:hypothetical protein